MTHTPVDDAPALGDDPLPNPVAGRRRRLATRLVNFALTVAFVTVLATLLGAALGWFRVVPVETGSMAPYAPAGSSVVVARVTAGELERGDVILFRAPTDEQPLVVHRIVAIDHSGNGPVIVTKGDANPTPDPWRFKLGGAEVWRVRFVIPAVGTVVDWTHSPAVGIPLLALAAGMVLLIGMRLIWSSRDEKIGDDSGRDDDHEDAEGDDGEVAAHANVEPPIEADVPDDENVHKDDDHKDDDHDDDHDDDDAPDAPPARPRRRLVIAGVTLLALVGAVAARPAFALFNSSASTSATYSSGTLNAPSPLNCRWTSATNVQLTWTNTSPGFATGYSYLRSNTSGSGYASIGTTVGEASTTGNDTNPAPPTIRYYVARSTRGTWSSPNSNEKASNTCGGAINLVAGNGTAGFMGDGGAATAARLDAPDAVAVDAAGNVYIADTANNRIRMVTPAGVISTFAGGGATTSCAFAGAATSVSLNAPRGVAVDSAGVVYIADTGRNCVRKVVGGSVSLVAGTGGTTSCGFSGAATSVSMSGPRGLAFDTADNLYIADTGRNCVRMVVGANISRVAGGGGSTACTFSGSAAGVSMSGPRAVAVDSAGNVFIADTGRNCIRAVVGGNVFHVAGGGGSTSCAYSGLATGVSLDTPSGVSIGPALGVVYVSDTNRDCVRKVAMSMISPLAGTGTAGYSGDGGPAIAARMDAQRGLAYSPAGDLYIADRGNDRVRVVVSPS